MRILLAIAAVTLFGAVAVAASASRVDLGRQSSAIVPPRYTAIPAIATTPPDIGARGARADARLAGRFVVPLEGAEIPEDPDLLPGAPRDYRAGIHEGIDFPAPAGTPARAAAAGTVTRIDSGYVEWSVEQQEVTLEEARSLGHTPEATLDRFRGRQVWIDHGKGVVTRYAHLSAVESLVVGQRVEAGAPIGAVGSSGYPQGGPHLHFEVRVGDRFYADELSGDALVRAVSRLFR